MASVKLVKGDLLESKAQTLVNTTNCVGVMGKGIALSFKWKYPDMFKDYKTRCNRKEHKLGEPYLYKHSPHRWIINFPTKGVWWNGSNLDDIDNGLKYLAEHIEKWGVTSIAIPHLGCENGGLSWTDVFPLIQKHLYSLPISIEIYEKK